MRECFFLVLLCNSSRVDLVGEELGAPPFPTLSAVEHVCLSLADLSRTQSDHGCRFQVQL